MGSWCNLSQVEKICLPNRTYGTNLSILVEFVIGDTSWAVLLSGIGLLQPGYVNTATS